MYAKVLGNQCKKSGRIYVGMENVSAGGIALSKPLQKAPHQQGLAGAGLSGEHEQATPRLDAEHHFRQGCFVRPPEEEKSHVRQGTKRIFPEPKILKKLLIWRGWNRIHKRTWGRAAGTASVSGDSGAGKGKISYTGE